MIIMITGAHGQLGTELIRQLKAGRSELGDLPVSYFQSTVLAVDIDQLDICSESAVHTYFEHHKPDLVINCAAMTDVDGCESNEELAYKVNALGPKYLAIACERYGARLLHISTDYVFRGDSKHAYAEDDIPSPVTAYGRTKLAGERFVQENCINSCICRTSWLYGYEGNNFVKTMLYLAAERDSLKVVDDQIGNPTCAVDLSYQLLLLGADSETGIFHCTGNGTPVSWYDFTQRIFKIADIDIPVFPCSTDEFPRPARRPAYSALDNAHLRASIGDSIRPWDIALKQFLTSYLNKEHKR
jgi:dTDP-4-dehydrorhamnose reductase